MIRWNWHLDAIAHALDNQVAQGQVRHLLVTACHPKSPAVDCTINLAWVAWLTGLRSAQAWLRQLLERAVSQACP